MPREITITVTLRGTPAALLKALKALVNVKVTA